MLPPTSLIYRLQLTFSSMDVTLRVHLGPTSSFQAILNLLGLGSCGQYPYAEERWCSHAGTHQKLDSQKMKSVSDHPNPYPSLLPRQKTRPNYAACRRQKYARAATQKSNTRRARGL